MRYNHFTYLLMVFLMAISCESPTTPSTDLTETNDPLEGAWEFVSSKVTLPDTTIIYDSQTNQKGLFIMLDGRFAFVSTSPDKANLTYAGHGSYAIEGKTFTEKTEFHSVTSLNGKTVRWEYEIKGEQLTKRGTLPVWPEIKPFAGDQTEVQFEEVRKRKSS